VQERVGVRARMDAGGRRSIRDFMPDQHRVFFAQLPFLLVGSTDAEGQPWASILAARPGFASSPDPKILRIDGRPLAGDPLNRTLHEGAEIGLLGIELPTRRRNRLNGVIAKRDPEGFTVSVRQSFGNCPQYIQARAFCLVDNPTAPRPAPAVPSSDRLTDADRALVGQADTFFIASANLSREAGAARGVDVSHRGGRPGFVRIDDERTLTTPDFAGNFFFNTIGNLQHDPRAGLLFIDFEAGDLLYLAGDAEIVWDGPEVAAFAGAQRLVRFHLRRTIRIASLPLRWSPPAFAPQLARTGIWQDAAASLAGKSAKPLP
jgi:predicted pyridoxine 5'-phosphate oxidase superfamily flavin-nucleotide-binding protein